MDDLSKHLEKLGDAVSDTADRTIDPGELSLARERWLASLPSFRHAPLLRRPARSLLLAAACFAALLCAVVLVLGMARRDRVSFMVGSPPVRGDVGTWVAAEARAPLPLQFSEGTRFTLSPGARARVTETTSHGATVLLERGNVAAAVVHVGDGTQWSLHAGPFEVRVTGTAFDASWDPTAEVFTVAMHEGTVVVQGPLLQPGHELRAGERLRVSARAGSLELRTVSVELSDGAPAPSALPQAGAPAAAVASTDGSSASSGSQEGSSGVVRADAPAARAAGATAEGARAPASEEQGWRDLAVAGKYGEALAAAERAGFSQEIERVSSQDLALLADVARYAARPALARQALLAQRRRFGTRGSSAFVLGKIAADQQGAPGEAVRWFETYLSEEPNGALAEQALGRVLELEKGHGAAAQAVAERYLARYPHGAHAALARSLAGSAPSTPKPPLAPTSP